MWEWGILRKCSSVVLRGVVLLSQIMRRRDESLTPRVAFLRGPRGTSVDLEPGVLRLVLLGFSVVTGEQFTDVLGFLVGDVRVGLVCSSAQRLRFCVVMEMTEGCDWVSSFTVWVIETWISEAPLIPLRKVGILLAV